MKNLLKKVNLQLKSLMTKADISQRTPRRRQTRFNYMDGPMVYIGQQIIRTMQDMGWETEIFEAYRTPERQAELKRQGRSKAPPWSSPHQYWCAVDIVLKPKKWPPIDHRFWKDLNAAQRVVAEKFGVELVHGLDWGWDAAHIELKNFRHYRDLYTGREMTQAEKDAMFKDVLPNVWKQYTRSVAYPTRLS